NWQIAGTSTIYTGPPFTPKLGTVDYTNGSASRPDRLSKGTLDNPTVDQWFDRTAFPIVPLGSYRWGSSGRNYSRWPGDIHGEHGAVAQVQIRREQGASVPLGLAESAESSELQSA